MEPTKKYLGESNLNLTLLSNSLNPETFVSASLDEIPSNIFPTSHLMDENEKSKLEDKKIYPDLNSENLTELFQTQIGNKSEELVVPEKIQNEQMKTTAPFETLDGLCEKFPERLFNQKKTVIEDLIRIFKTSAIAVSFNETSVNLDTFGSLEDTISDKDKTFNQIENRFFNLAANFSEFFLGNQKVLGFLTREIVKLLTLKRDKVIFEDYYRHFYLKLFDNTDFTKIKEEFAKKFSDIPFDKALKYLKLSQNLISQELIYLIPNHLMSVRCLKFSKDRMFAKRVPNASCVNINFEKNYLDITYKRKEGIVFSDVILSTQYTIRFHLQTEKLELPINLQMAIYCPLERQKAINELIKVYNLENENASEKKEVDTLPEEFDDLIEIKEMLRDLPEVAKGLNYPVPLNIIYESAIKDEKSQQN